MSGFSTEEFSLHPRLLGESVFVQDLELSRLVLMNNRRFPWVLLVPRLPDIAEIVDLAEPDQRILWGEIARISRLFRKLFEPDKLNVATIGNLVPQLHVHLIARFRTDEAWPKPPFGFAPPIPYTPEERADLIARICAELSRDEKAATDISRAEDRPGGYTDAPVQEPKAGRLELNDKRFQALSTAP